MPSWPQCLCTSKGVSVSAQLSATRQSRTHCVRISDELGARPADNLQTSRARLLPSGPIRKAYMARLPRRLVLNQLDSVASVVADERKGCGRVVAHLERHLDAFGFQLREDTGQVFHLEAEVLHAVGPEVF